MLAKRPGLSGYHTIAAGLTDLVAASGPLDVDHLRAWSSADSCEVFGQERDGPASELMAHFSIAVNDLGHLVADGYGGSFLSMVEDARGSAARLVAILDRLPYFSDVSRYRGLTVPLYKRAQITAADLARAFAGQGPGAFRDLDRLTIFADNLVPHVLRLDGVLRYDPELADRIETGDLLAPGEPAEVEIRAGAVHAVERLSSRLIDRGVTAATPAALDLVLWNRGGEAAYKAVPRHRCRCVAY